MIRDQQTGEGPLEQIIFAEEVAALKPEYQEVLVKLLQGYSTGEIAQQIGRCKETVRRRLRFIRGRLEA